MPDYSGLRAANVFRPIGMPDIDNSSIAELLSSVIPAVNSMKNDDLFRQKELMQFQHSLANQRPPEMVLPTRGPNAIKKQHIVNYAPPTQMQQKFAREDAEQRDQKFRMGQLQAQQEGALNNALATGRQRSEADMQRLTTELNARKEESAAERASREKIAETGRKAAAEERVAGREFQAEQARLNREQKGQPFMIDDPNNPGKQMAVRWNPANETLEPITHQGQTVTGLTKPGTPKAGQFKQPTNLTDMRRNVQDILNEFDNVLDKNDQLTSKGQSAFGKSAAFRWIPGSEEKSGTASVKRIQSQQILNLIEDMKAQSKTGATGFGAMNMRELAVLESAASKLSDPYISEEDGRKELKRLRDQLRLVLQDEGAAQPEKDAPGTNSVGKKPRLDPDELLKKYGGG